MHRLPNCHIIKPHILYQVDSSGYPSGHKYSGVGPDDAQGIQDLESEADQETVNILKNKGFDPWDYWRLMKMLKAIADKNPRGFYEQYYSKHPYAGERLEKIEKMITSLSPAMRQKAGGEEVSRSSTTTLGEAVILGDAKKVEALLSAGADVNERIAFTLPTWNRGRESRTRVLVAAIVYGRPEVVDVLLRHKPSFLMFHNAFAICSAVNSGQTKVVAALIKAGIDVNPDFTCIRRLSPLESARRRGRDKIAQMLVEAGAK